MTNSDWVPPEPYRKKLADQRNEMQRLFVDEIGVEIKDITRQVLARRDAKLALDTLVEMNDAALLMANALKGIRERLDTTPGSKPSGGDDN